MKDLRKPLRFWESVLLCIPAVLLLAALTKGYGPILGFWSLVILVVGYGIRLAVLLWELF